MSQAKEVKTVPVSIRFPVDLKNTLDDAAYLVDQGTTSLVLEGVGIVLDRIRAEHGGKIPPRPRRQAPASEPEKKRGKK